VYHRARVHPHNQTAVTANALIPREDRSVRTYIPTIRYALTATLRPAPYKDPQTTAAPAAAVVRAAIYHCAHARVEGLPRLGIQETLRHPRGAGRKGIRHGDTQRRPPIRKVRLELPHARTLALAVGTNGARHSRGCPGRNAGAPDPASPVECLLVRRRPGAQGAGGLARRRLPGSGLNAVQFPRCPQRRRCASP